MLRVNPNSILATNVVSSFYMQSFILIPQSLQKLLNYCRQWWPWPIAERPQIKNLTPFWYELPTHILNLIPDLRKCLETVIIVVICDHDCGWRDPKVNTNLSLCVVFSQDTFLVIVRKPSFYLGYLWNCPRPEWPQIQSLSLSLYCLLTQQVSFWYLIFDQVIVRKPYLDARPFA